jgi:hypothetical protein
MNAASAIGTRRAAEFDHRSFWAVLDERHPGEKAARAQTRSVVLAARAAASRDRHDPSAFDHGPPAMARRNAGSRSSHSARTVFPEFLSRREYFPNLLSLIVLLESAAYLLVENQR